MKLAKRSSTSFALAAISPAFLSRARARFSNSVSELSDVGSGICVTVAAGVARTGGGEPCGVGDADRVGVGNDGGSSGVVCAGDGWLKGVGGCVALRQPAQVNP